MSEGGFDPEAFRRFEHTGWTEVAGRYDDTFGNLTGQTVEALLDAAGVANGEQVLDLACGTGRVAAGVIRRGGVVTGLDLTQAMVDQATRLCPRGTFKVGDAESLPFAPGTFDLVTCGFGLLHFPQPERAVAQVFSILRDGGRFACSLWSPAERSPFLALIRDAIAAHGTHDVPLPQGPPAYQFGDPERLTALLNDAGFRDVSTTEADVKIQIDSEDQVLDALLEGGVRGRKLLQAQTPEAFARIAEFAANRARDFRVGNVIEIPRPALLAVGVKP